MKFENISCDTQLPTKEKDTIRFLYRLSVDNTHGGANKVGIFQVKLKSEANFIDQIAFFTPENGGFENDLKSDQTTSPECKNLLGFVN